MNATMRYVLAVVGAAAVLMLGATAQVVHEGNCSPVQIEESVIFHASNSLDVGDIEEALTMSPPDFELAREIYTVGKNAPYTKSPTGLRSLQFMSTKDLSAEPLAAGFVKLYDSITWMDDYMMAALNGTGEFEGKSDELRAMAAMKNAVAILTVFSDHEVEVALAQAAGGSALNAPKIDSNSTNIHWDEYFAFYYGLTGVDSPAEVSMERDADFGTSIMMRALDDFSVGRTAALMTDFSGIRAAQRSITAGYLITFLQSTLKYAYQLQSGQGGDAEWAGAYTSWRTMSGAIAAEDMEAAQRIESMLSLSAGSIDQLDPNVYCGVKAEIEAVLPVMGVQMIDMGNLSEDNGNGILIGADACSTELNGA